MKEIIEKKHGFSASFCNMGCRRRKTGKKPSGTKKNRKSKKIEFNFIKKNRFHGAMFCIAKMLRAELSVLPRSSCVSWSPQAKSPIPRMLASR